MKRADQARKSGPVAAPKRAQTLVVESAKMQTFVTPIDANARPLASAREKCRKIAPGFARKILKGFVARFVFGPRPHLAHALLALGCVWALSVPLQAQSAPAIFPQIRALSLEQARAMAMKRSPALALSTAQVAAAQANERDVSRRIKIDTTGGLDPFSGKVRFYLGLDLERLAGLNRAEKENARQKVAAEKIGALTSEQGAMARVSTAWYSLETAEMAVASASRRAETSRALYVAADAKFKAGVGELGGVLGALSGTSEAEDAYQSARQRVALGCLELAQSCGYLTAEAMESDL